MLKLALPLLACGLLAAQGAQRAEALTAHLREAALVHGTFTQTRHLSALSRPLVSSGSIVVDRDRGVIWSLKKPLSRTFVMGPGGIVELDASGQRARQASREAPMVTQMGRIVKSLLKGQWDAVEDYFKVSGEGTAERWEITLAPKPAAAAFLKRVTVKGGALLERIHVEEASGDSMDLQFQNLRTDLPLGEAEAHLFSLR